jgi:hypothetical protein
MRRNDYDVTGSVRTTDPASVGTEVLHICEGLYGRPAPELERAFGEAAALYEGRHPDYCACDTEYHDIQHVLDVTLAMARLMDGYQRGRRETDEPLSRELFITGALAALFHDFGYLRRRHDRRHRYGAEYTLIHVSRSAAFLRRYLRDLGLSEKMARIGGTLVHFTGYERRTELIAIEGTARRAGQMLGTADIIAQMSDRCYLEKCRDRLFPEFVVGRLASHIRPALRMLPAFDSGQDLVLKTPQFYRGAMRRLDMQLARSYQYAARHFGGPNLYLDEMQKNVLYAAAVAAAPYASGLLRRQPPHTLLPEVEPYPRDLISAGGAEVVQTVDRAHPQVS